VGLSYGRPLAVTRPLTVVQTCFTASEVPLFGLEEVIIGAQMRDDAWSREDWEGEPNLFEQGPHRVQVPTDGFERADHMTVMAGENRSVGVVSPGGYEALRFGHGDLIVTGVARNGPHSTSSRTWHRT
jgi:hypothetical protein